MEFDLHDQSILVVVGGSRAYGIHTPDSDVDIRGVLIQPREYYFSLRKNVEQVEGSDHMEVWTQYLTEEQKMAVNKEKIEGTIYELRKFMGLAADCNPNILDVLFSRQEEVIYSNWLGCFLRDHRDAFLSSRSRYSFSGYAHSQLKRIKEHRSWLLNPPTHQPTREEFGLGVVPQHTRNVLFAAIHGKIDEWAWNFGEMPTSEIVRVKEDIANHMADMGVVADDSWLYAGRSLGMGEELLEALSGEKRYRDAKKNWSSYQTWLRQRNPARAALEAKSGYDTKHGAHLVRLLRMGREALETGKVNVWRGDIDREELLDVRRGAWDYEALVEWASEQDREMTDIYTSMYGTEKQRTEDRVKKGLVPLLKRDPVLPKAPDMNRLDMVYETLLNSVLHNGGL